ncbi:MAG: LysR family transcriptional regulator [Enterocloster bolteae]
MFPSSTISVAIQKLEDELGIKLMERDNKGIRITGAGGNISCKR